MSILSHLYLNINKVSSVPDARTLDKSCVCHLLIHSPNHVHKTFEGPRMNDPGLA